MEDTGHKTVFEELHISTLDFIKQLLGIVCRKGRNMLCAQLLHFGNRDYCVLQLIEILEKGLY